MKQDEVVIVVNFRGSFTTKASIPPHTGARLQAALAGEALHGTDMQRLLPGTVPWQTSH